jgi:hypothetical protein
MSAPSQDERHYLNIIRSDHYVGLYRININRLDQAENTENDIAGRDLESSHINSIASDIVNTFLVFQSPLQANCIPVPEIPATTNKLLFNQACIDNSEIRFKVFGHQHFLAAMKTAIEHSEKVGNHDLAKRLEVLDVSVWVGLSPKDGRLLSNLHNDTCHNIRSRDVWQFIRGLRINWRTLHSPTEPVEDTVLARKEFKAVKTECFRLENVTGNSEINLQFIPWKVATFPAETFKLLLDLNTLYDQNKLKGMAPLSRTQQVKQAERLAFNYGEGTSLYSHTQKNQV